MSKKQKSAKQSEHAEHTPFKGSHCMIVYNFNVFH